MRRLIQVSDRHTSVIVSRCGAVVELALNGAAAKGIDPTIVPELGKEPDYFIPVIGGCEGGRCNAGGKLVEWVSSGPASIPETL
jgi:hypothetical protein